jgi:CheY-like chemotaxis protein
MSVQDTALLVVEDDADALLLLKRAFRKVGLQAQIHVATDGEAAVDYLAGQGAFGDRRAHPLPALILLDIKLPKRSGLEVLEWMAKHPHLRQIPVIIVTSSDEERDRQRATELGVKDYNVKPIDSDSLVRLAEKIDKYFRVSCDKLGQRSGDGSSGPS